MSQSEIGLIGLAVMGENLALNIESKGFPISVYNRTTAKTEALVAGRAKGKKFYGAKSMEDFIGSLKRPRKIIMLVKAGAPVDEMIDQVVPLLEKGDILIDGGNSFFKDTMRRYEALKAKGIRYIGSGVSGGEEGALNGPSLMPGGDKDAFDEIAPIWRKIAAQVDDGPCTTYVGPNGAGHFVKMVHNGIEYGDMQLIAEVYDFMRTALLMPAKEIGDVFTRWNQGLLQSYLIEITSEILPRVDPETGKPLVDLILDKAGQKGTGIWTTQVALDLGIATPTINAAVEARTLSSYKDERVAASKILEGPKGAKFTGNKADMLEALHDALYASKICSYAQGMALIKAASAEYKWNVDLGETSRIWKGGCIIRAQFLDRIKQAYVRNPNLANLLLDPEFTAWVTQAQPKWRKVVSTSVALGIPVLALGGSLSYYDSYRRESLPQNLTQAQRDYFGAHTYLRTDKPGEGPFHTEWAQE